MPLLKVGGIDINFPFTPYPCQLDYMKKMVECLQTGVNGILESPTGTGKTLCLLCSSLAWLQNQKAHVQMNKEQGLVPLINDKENITDNFMKKLADSLQQSAAVPKIIYASRTHSQLSQAVQELKRTSYNNMKAAVIGSREQLCINETVKKEVNNAAKVHMCRAKVSARKCHYYNTLEVRSIVGDVVDIEDLVRRGEKSKVCPYYLARELKTDADIIFMPYNYLLDPKSRRANGVELQGNIIIFDEAHNLEKICEDSASFDLSSVDIATAMEEVTKLMEKLVDLAAMEDQTIGGDDDVTLGNDYSLVSAMVFSGTLKDFEENLDAVTIPKDGLTKPGSYIFELLAGVGITYDSKNIIIDLLEKIVAYLTNSSSGLHTKGAGISKYTDSLKKVFSQEIGSNMSILQHQEAVTQSFKVHIHQKEKENNKKKIDSWATNGNADKKERILSFWCFSSGQTMKELKAHGVKSIILTSGTLSPISSFTMEMQIPFPVTLENPHVIEEHQVCVCTLKVGPDSYRLNSSYNHRFEPRYLTSLGNAIVNFSRIVPNGLLIFFPSYTVMDKSVEFWQGNNIWDRITQYKPIFVEPTNKRGFVETIDEFYEKVNDPSKNGAIFMAVCRGKVSEGLDFADTNGRAVLITGIPYPPMKDPKVILKRQFLDEMVRKGNKNMLIGQKWYTQQATRAVNQAIGRVIRHKQDYGAIILCDERFARNESIQQLPVWVRPYVNNFDNYGKAQGYLLRFFKTAESKVRL
ncbi:hypothetical protein LOTGIDRAFT_118438 [Lottia gigantea]|uniref:Regulator of telomere elongation helicase 1 homolog n=1 Tax=Lottia gigantea TaxID=225164 RepID=V4ACD9_LOTGI|nr:hypothetical protein LOTGIDRAFT_118438 [Lottia gigantea]ESO94497.1 hypothetical protein LOTGIDRAFT_118438 [Lottia gigantea]